MCIYQLVNTPSPSALTCNIFTDFAVIHIHACELPIWHIDTDYGASCQLMDDMTQDTQCFFASSLRPSDLIKGVPVGCPMNKRKQSVELWTEDVTWKR